MSTKTIWKYTITEDQSDIEVPGGGTVLTVGNQFGSIVLWVELDPSMTVVERSFKIIGTGWDTSVTCNMIYIGTVQINQLVWHIYEELCK